MKGNLRLSQTYNIKFILVHFTLGCDIFRSSFMFHIRMRKKGAKVYIFKCIINVARFVYVKNVNREREKGYDGSTICKLNAEVDDDTILLFFLARKQSEKKQPKLYKNMHKLFKELVVDFRRGFQITMPSRLEISLRDRHRFRFGLFFCP